MDSKKLALLCGKLADAKKAENIVILDVKNLSSITDYFVIASGATEPHLRAIVTEITDKLRDEFNLRPRAVDGDLENGLAGGEIISTSSCMSCGRTCEKDTTWRACGATPNESGEARGGRNRKKTTRPLAGRRSCGYAAAAACGQQTRFQP